MNIQKSPLSVRNAALLALGISILMHVLFLIMFYYQRDVFPSPDEPHVRRENNWGLTLIHVASSFLIAFGLYLLNFYLLKKEYGNDKLKWLLIIPVMLLAATVLSYMSFSIRLFLENPAPPHPEKMRWGGFFRDYTLAVIVMLSSQLLYITYKQKWTIIENKNLVLENIRSRFQALKNQVDPHFLFNSLNTLNSLIKLDPDKAQEYVQQLAFVFRYTLRDKEVISLEEELDFTNAYCQLMQIRYGENLRFVMNIEESLLSYQIIPLSLQVLVENAIKHNVISNKQPLTITFSHEKDLYIKVSNPINPKRQPESGGHIGLKNLNERCELIWKRSIIVHKTDDCFEVSVPIKKQSHESIDY